MRNTIVCHSAYSLSVCSLRIFGPHPEKNHSALSTSEIILRYVDIIYFLYAVLSQSGAGVYSSCHWTTSSHPPLTLTHNQS